MIYFYSQVHLTLQTMLMTVPHIRLAALYIIYKLESHSRTLIEWYGNNYLKPNPDKWHLILSEPGDSMKIMIGNEIISNSAYEKCFEKRQGKSYMLLLAYPDL